MHPNLKTRDPRRETRDDERLSREPRGQGLVEYTLIILFVVFAIWVLLKDTGVGEKLAGSWTDVGQCLEKPLDCKKK